VLIVAAVFAQQIGMDNNADWGRSRTLLLLGGLFLLLAGPFVPAAWERLAKLNARVSAFIDSRVSRSIRVAAAALAAAAVVIPAYFWFLQLEQRTAALDYEYYIELARSFKQGQLHLEEEPSAVLLSLENPYDYAYRRQHNIYDFPWDVSLYKSRFYVYWGPAPAIFLSLLPNAWLAHLGDFHVALASASGVFIYMALLIARFWRESLQRAPLWLLFLCLLTVGLATPVTIMLKGARIYEAAIFGSQFFLIGGFYWAYSALREERPVPWKLALASIHWTLAIGTRVIILPAAVFCVLFTLFHVIFPAPDKRLKALTPLIASLLLPLALGGILHGWYNWARFDSVLEFGQRYQITNVDYTNFDNVFSASRIKHNLPLYLAHPLQVAPKFPYLSRVEYLNSSERMGGLIYIAPYVLLLIVPGFYLAGSLLRAENPFKTGGGSQAAENWLFGAAMGSTLISFALLMSFFFVTMRYMEDFMPSLLLLITTQVGRAHDDLRENRLARTALILVTTVFALVTIAANTLLAVPGSGTGFMLNFINDVRKFLGLK
jgi:hypothetical protein